MAKTLDLKNLRGARKAKLPEFISPQLATLVKAPPPGDDWLHELKFDGYRMLCRVERGKVRVWSRNGKEWTVKFPTVINAIKQLKVSSAMFDGEIMIVDAQGRSSFQKLQRAMAKSITKGFVYEVFDLLHLDGFDLTRVPLKKRKELLKELCGEKRDLIRYSEHLEGNGDAFFKRACEYGIEGIVSKLANSTYASTRNRNWLKVKCNKEQEFIIVGYTASSKGMPGFGSLVLAVYEKNKLVYSGRVGTGFTIQSRTEIQKQLDKIARKASPLSSMPNEPDLRKAVWTEPKLVAQVAFAEWTDDGVIRHPSFQGLREDKKAKEVVKEHVK
ncbi:MAG TPA: non-homologous end-joining DNA ligase [Pyrinomonadaceae bacterium]|nr:non-homologous end-joining DNA ligase [Pyrinomonadaceae bacterium]